MYLLFYFSVQKDDIGAHINVGRTYNNLKLYKQAEDAYLKVRIHCAYFIWLPVQQVENYTRVYFNIYYYSKLGTFSPFSCSEKSGKHDVICCDGGIKAGILISEIVTMSV